MFAWLIYVDLFQIAWPTSPGANRLLSRWSKRLFGTCLVHLWDQRSGVLVESDVTKMQWVSGILMGYDCFFRCDIDGIFMGLPSGNDQQFAIENCHRNSWFTHQKLWFSIVMFVYQRIIFHDDWWWFTLIDDDLWWFMFIECDWCWLMICYDDLMFADISWCLNDAWWFFVFWVKDGRSLRLSGLLRLPVRLESGPTISHDVRPYAAYAIVHYSTVLSHGCTKSHHPVVMND